MKLLIDESLQRELAGVLNGHGHDAVHVADVGLQGRIRSLPVGR